MRIAYVYDAVYPYILGGVEKRVWEIARRLVARGHDVHLFGMHLWDGESTITRDGVVLHGICRPYGLYRKGKRRILPAFLFGIMLLPALARERFDVVDCQQFPYTSVFGAAAACRIARSPFVITWHEVWGEYWYEYLGWKGVFGKITERLVARLTPDIIPVSGTTAKKLAHLGVPDEIRIIPNGIDPVHIRSVPPSPESSDIIFVGRLIKEKHVDVLVRAFAQLLPESPALTLLILGDGPELDTIRSLISEPGIRDRVLLKPFLDSHDEVVSLMKSSHVCVIPSTREGFGIAALEALACGLPVVTVDHPENAIGELITGATGFRSSLSVDDLSDTIRDALSRYPVMKPACMASAEAYDWDGIVDRVEDYFNSLAGRTG